MSTKTHNVHLPAEQNSDNEKTGESEFPLYPVNEDIYNQLQREEEIDPEYFAAEKTYNPNDKKGVVSENEFTETGIGDDLDIPGSELDDDDELIGSEDEENNYYSVGGDNHTNLEEEQGE